ncbi:hypothetical protein [Roseococcus sp.]|uniref:hypothetical protein n=1 Tax=Roseococcus sp. TaxID=2109646 RepID=UPI003BAAF88C
MPSLIKQKDFRAVAKLPFCYVCGETFTPEDATDRDHVPPQAMFATEDRSPPLILRTHTKCNGSRSLVDKQTIQLIGLKRRVFPTSERDEALKFEKFNHVNSPFGATAVTNLNVDEAVARWITGFHAALYQEHLTNPSYNIQTPFPRADHDPHSATLRMMFRPIEQIHLNAIKVIKLNRAFNNLDRIVANNDKLRYECVWVKDDQGTRWWCMFALDIYDWKDLGSSTQDLPPRGCVGYYHAEDGSLPSTATREHKSTILVPNLEPYDPFGS